MVIFGVMCFVLTGIYHCLCSCINTGCKPALRFKEHLMRIRMKNFFSATVVLFLFVTAEADRQASVRKMSTTINHPSLNIFAPYISADANAIVFLSDNAEDNALTPFFSFRENADWHEP